MSTLHGFELVREQQIPELNTTARLYRHLKTGARLLSMSNDDENKVFGINFYTPPSDSTGLPHIMEHSVLCGSRKYPLKEPFVELLKGSLKTFVNAMTFADKTCYPVASQNTKDFYNLIDVYMDAVLHPLIPPHTLQQEGWHYELEKTDDPLIFKGVVFNEMKGAYSSPDGLLQTYAQTAVFPDTHYGHDSGGDPKAIPDLTYEQFRSFHDTYYHPSNSYIWFYGDDDPEERLRLMDTYLSEFAPAPVSTEFPKPAPFAEPRRVTFPFDAGEDAGSKKAMLAINWVLADTREIELALSLDILSYILIGTPASPLRRALIDSGLGEKIVEIGVDDQIRDMTFTTGLKGINPEDADKVETLILQTLEQLAQQGLDPDMIEAALNTVEFRLRENNTGSFPRGLLLMLYSLSTWIYDGDPIAPLAFEAPLKTIKGRIAAGERYFEHLIRERLLDNPHRATVILTPDATLREQEDSAERQRLDRVRAALTEDDLKQLVDETLELKRLQETPDSPEELAKLPSLKLSDLDRQQRTIPLTVLKGGATTLYHDLFTNGILYLDLALDLHLLPQEYLPYVGLYSRALLEMGTNKESFVKLSQRIGRKTGGVNTTSLTSMIKDSNTAVSKLILRGKGTMAQVDDLLAILSDVLTEVQFDNRERFRQIVLESKASREQQIVPGGHTYANMRVRAHFNEADWAVEQMSGVSALFFVRQLAEQIEQDWASVLDKLQTMHRILVNRQAILVNVTLDAANWAQVEPKLNAFLNALPTQSAAPASWIPTHTPSNEGLAIPAQVNYVAKGADLYKLGYETHGSMSVITNYLRTTWLWERIRVLGGAYGGTATFSDTSGAFTFLSWRDPNLLGTVENFDNTATFLRELDFNDQELTRGIIGAISNLDGHLLPDAKGFQSMVWHLIGESDEDRQRYREEVLNTRIDDFKAFADVLARVNEAGIVAVVGSEAKMNEANAQRGGDWLTITKVL
jgi:presequence protease